MLNESIERCCKKPKSAFNRMVRARKRLLRLDRKIRDHQAPGAMVS